MLTDHILFLDGEALVIDKPSGLPVDPPRDGGISLQNHLSTLTFGFKRWPQAVHRLDRDTSGCLLLARNPKAHARFARAFEERLVEKSYLAVLSGVPAETSGTIDLALLKVSNAADGWRMVGDPSGRRGGKASVTHWETVQAVGDRALIRFTPQTGRTHQLRVHALEGLGHAIVGDPVYGPASGTRSATMLHADHLVLHRGDKPPVVAHAPFPAAFAALGFADPAPGAATLLSAKDMRPNRPARHARAADF